MTRYALLAAPLIALLLAALIFLPSIAQAQTPPDTPASVTVTRADGALAVSGYSVGNATKYHITYSSDGGYSWTDAADSHAESDLIITGVDNATAYIVRVRAGNEHGWSDWRNSPEAGPYTAEPTPTPTPEPDGDA